MRLRAHVSDTLRWAMTNGAERGGQGGWREEKEKGQQGKVCEASRIE